MTGTEYIASIVSALSYNSRTYFPPDADARKKWNLRLGRELGYGLAAYDNWESLVGSTYSNVIVRHCFDSTGVVIDAKDWVAAIKTGVAQYKDYQAKAHCP